MLQKVESKQRPFRREPLIEGNAWKRLLAAKVRAYSSGTSLTRTIEEGWPDDPAMEMVARAVSAPAMTSTAGWAAELAHKIVADSLKALGPMSAGALLMRAGLVLLFDSYGQISVPGFVANAANAGFVAEGDPIPVRQLSAAGPLLLPHKLASIAALTQEMIDSTNAEALIGDALTRSAALALDQALFDSNAASAARPAGLRNGIAASINSTATDLHEAMLEDVATLISAVAQVGGPGPYVIVCSPGRAISMMIRATAYIVAQPTESLIGAILGTPAVGNDIIAVAAAGLVSAFNPNPEVETSNAATLVMDDTSPSTPDTTQPTKSLFQTASVAVKMKWPVSWALRDSRAVAWLTPSWK